MQGRGGRLLVWWLMFLSAAMPFFYALYCAFINPTGPDVVKEVLEFLGDTAFIYLLLTLSVTPLRRHLGQSWLQRFRRMLGLYCLFYAALHLSIYFGIMVDFSALFEELVKRPYVLVGALAFIVLLALGLTSPKFMMRRMGRRWKSLHRWIYVAVILVWLHMFWQSRGDVGEAMLYGAVTVLLLLLRVPRVEEMFKKNRKGYCSE